MFIELDEDLEGIPHDQNADWHHEASGSNRMKGKINVRR